MPMKIFIIYSIFFFSNIKNSIPLFIKAIHYVKTSLTYFTFGNIFPNIMKTNTIDKLLLGI